MNLINPEQVMDQMSENGNGKSESLAVEDPIRVVHIFEQFFKLGGVQGRLRKHLEGDRRWGIDPRFIITWEKQDRPQHEPMVYFLGMKVEDSFRLYLKRFDIAIERTRPLVAIYHTVDEKLFSLDKAKRRIFFLNNQWDNMDGWLRHMLPWADGVLSPSEPLCELARSCWGSAGEGRVFFIAQPICPPESLPPRPPLKDRPLVLGVCGRLVKKQKQVELLPSLFAHLEQAGIPFRVEFLGDGRERSWLEAELPRRDKYVFHGA